MCDLIIAVGIFRVMVMGLWSDRIIGSIAALVRKDRPFWVKKKWSILEYLLCGGEKKVKSLSLGCNVRHVSCSNKSLNCVFMAHRALYASEHNPVDVSREGFMATLKSSPTIRVPEWNVNSCWSVSRKKATCCVLGAYIFTMVMGVL